ncbi:hypothetical protein [Cupriavidus numazuensis]|uniref:hypothetical protein n=1 Tax=Cupriavidus numazuensis TaxID=221992 RepID=UPI001BA85EBE|nr:hypothetical protein [Cupriavidus numazuensis]
MEYSSKALRFWRAFNWHPVFFTIFEKIRVSDSQSKPLTIGQEVASPYAEYSAKATVFDSAFPPATQYHDLLASGAKN